MSPQGDLQPMGVHRLPLDEAPHGYEVFRDEQEDCIELVLKPQG